MTERPILFSAEMVRAILAGKKTQTRRCFKKSDFRKIEYAVQLGECHDPRYSEKRDSKYLSLLCPYGQPGDRLWVRETHYRMPSDNPSMGTGFGECYYDADIDLPTLDTLHSWGMFKKYQSLFMPRWASRILLEITDVRCERLQDISTEDALAEGVTIKGDASIASHMLGLEVSNAQLEYWYLWESINGKTPGKRWEDSPWVWVIEFKVVKP